MAALTMERDTPEIMNGGRLLSLPVKGGVTIYQGAIVALDADGYAVPGIKAAGLTAVGRAEETVTNPGADGAETVKALRGVFVYANSATAADKVTAKHLLQPCYIEDDQTVTAAAAGASVAGLVLRADENGVAVQLGTPVPATAAATT
ncbi:MAG: hypothetical protein HFH27_08005 [Clostridiaceae bacterium]|nr:hypothetical protein [Clostridiaceae bacterium]